MNRMKNVFSLVCILMLGASSSFAQLDLKYQIPHKAILELSDVPMAPSVRINTKGDKIVLLERNRFKSIVELSEQELRLGGLRINPVTNIGSRVRYKTGISIQVVGEQNRIEVQGLPEEGRFANFSWSPDESFMAFTNTTLKGVELWVLNIEKAKAIKLSEDKLNANMGRPFSWYRDSKSLLVRFLPNDKKSLIEKSTAVPYGPTVTVNDGKKAQNRTYQDLLKDKSDEFNFEQLVRSELYKVNVTGEKELWRKADMYKSFSFSPDEEYVLLSKIEKPFSYLVPMSRFPSKTIIFTKEGKELKTILEVPLVEDLPKGFMSVRQGMRNLSWRSDRPSSLYWAEALDGGDPAKDVELRDQVFSLDAPFTDKPLSLLKTKYRFAGIMWGNKNHAVAYNYWWNSRTIQTLLFNPSHPEKAARVLNERNYQDRYSDPGNFITSKNEYGRQIIEFDGTKVYLNGSGYSKDGVRPFIDEMDLKTGEKDRLWQADGKTTLERISDAINMKKGIILTNVQSKNDYPNYYIRNIKRRIAPQQITFTKNPFESIKNIHKELIKYKREDGVELSATLYLPAGYDMEKKEKLPMIMWAYPKEFKDKVSAGQVTSSPNEFVYPYYGSPIAWVNRGYVVLDDAAFPIIGEGDTEPNDTFMKQLVGNAKAAIDAVDDLGYIDRNRVAVGGHSYGAFMTANLLSHSNLFAAGIARSGAYNRTLTPFGFQSEERSYWEAPNVYNKMSPFMNADKMKTPLLLIHGQADNNSGTYTMQSERYFNALKGLGATVRLVVLPKESHGYAAKESVLHVLWEQDQWLEKYVKNRKMTIDTTKTEK